MAALGRRLTIFTNLKFQCTTIPCSNLDQIFDVRVFGRYGSKFGCDGFMPSKLTSRIYLEFYEHVIVCSRSINNVKFFDFEYCLLDAVTILVIVHFPDIFSFVHYTKKN